MRISNCLLIPTAQLWLKWHEPTFSRSRYMVHPSHACVSLHLSLPLPLQRQLLLTQPLPLMGASCQVKASASYATETVLTADLVQHLIELLGVTSTCKCIEPSHNCDRTV